MFSIRRAGDSDAAGILECLRSSFEPYRESYTPGGFADTVLAPETIGQRGDREQDVRQAQPRLAREPPRGRIEIEDAVGRVRVVGVEADDDARLREDGIVRELLRALPPAQPDERPDGPPLVRRVRLLAIRAGAPGVRFVFAGKIVLVGATTPTLHDIFPTPFASQSGMPGVEIHAHTLETLLQGIPLRRAPMWLVPAVAVALPLYLGYVNDARTAEAKKVAASLWKSVLSNAAVNCGVPSAGFRWLPEGRQR